MTIGIFYSSFLIFFEVLTYTEQISFKSLVLRFCFPQKNENLIFQSMIRTIWIDSKIHTIPRDSEKRRFPIKDYFTLYEPI